MAAPENGGCGDSFEDDILFDIYTREARYAGFYDDGSSADSLMVALKSAFGTSFDMKLLNGIDDVFEKHCSLMPLDQRKTREKLILDVLKIVNEHLFLTPGFAIKPTNQLNDATTKEANAPQRGGKRLMKDKNLSGRVLLPECCDTGQTVGDAGQKRKRVNVNIGTSGNRLSKPIILEDDVEVAHGPVWFDKTSINKQIGQSCQEHDCKKIS